MIFVLSSLFSSHEPKNKGEQQAYDDACCDREIDCEILFLHHDVAGQASEPWELAGDSQNKSEGYYDCAYDYE